MRSLELYNRVIGSLDQAAIPLYFAGGAGAVVLALLLFMVVKLRPVATMLGLLGVLALIMGLVLVHEAKIVDQRDEFVTVRHWKFSERVRLEARIALLSLPSLAAFVMLQMFRKAQRQRRLTLPTHLKEGKIQFAHGDYDAAVSSYNEVLKIAPYFGDAYYQRGCAHEAKGRVEAALADYDQALSHDPHIAGAYLHRGRVRTESGDFDAAEEDFNHFMAMRPNDVVGFLNRGICLARKGDSAKAAADFHRVLKLTNHSDFADPARRYLADLEATAAAATEAGGASPAPLDAAAGSDSE